MRSIILFYFPVWYHAGRFPWGSMGFAGSSSAVPCGSRTFHWIRRKIFLWNPWSSLLAIQRRTMNARTIQLNAARTGTQTHVVLKCLCNFVAPSTVHQWVSYWYWLSKFHAFRSQRPLWITILWDASSSTVFEFSSEFDHASTLCTHPFDTVNRQ